MKTRTAVKVMAVVTVLMAASFSQADMVTIVSPDKAETYATSRVKQAKFRWQSKDAALYADVTFSDGLYAGKGSSPTREYFLFKFPGVTFDQAAKTFYAQDNAGHRVPVAVMKDSMFGDYVEPMPGTCVYISYDSGTVHLVLKATTNTGINVANHWVKCGNIIGQESLATR